MRTLRISLVTIGDFLLPKQSKKKKKKKRKVEIFTTVHEVPLHTAFLYHHITHTDYPETANATENNKRY